MALRLVLVEHEKEHGQTDGTKCIDQRPEQHNRWNNALQNVQHIENQIPDKQRHYQDRSDQRQQGRTFEGHAWSMNVASFVRKRRGPDVTLVP
jgi:hypothetical protein